MKNLLYFLFFCLTIFPNFIFAKENKSFSTDNLNHLHVKNLSGNLTIKASDKNSVQVDYEKIKFSQKCKLTMEKVDGVLKVEVKRTKSSWFNDCKVNFDISLPKKIDLRLDQGSGNMNIKGIESEVQINMGSGDLAYDSQWIDELTVKSGSGDIDIKGIAGEANIVTGSGDVNLVYALHAIPSSLDISSGSGNINVDGLKGDADVVTGSGGVGLRYGKKVNETGKVSIKSGSGNGRIYLPKTVKAISVNHKAASGKVKSSIVQSDDAKWSVYMRSGSGNLTIETID